MVTVKATKYPIGPVSLVELEYWIHDAHFQTVRHAGFSVIDVVAWANQKKAETGIYPSYGHIDGRTARWIDISGEVIARPMLTVAQKRINEFLATLGG